MRCCPACLGLLLLALVTLGASAASSKRVLILDPFGRDVAPFSAVVSSFRATLARELGERVDIYELPLELARLAEAEGEGPLVTFLEGQVKAHPVDLVVPIGGPGVQFAARHRQRLFSDTPVLAVAVASQMVPPGFLQTNTTLVTQKANIPGIVEDILRLRPQTTNIVVVLGTSALEKFWVEECRREFQPFTNRVTFTWLNDLSSDQILKRCATLPPRSFIFHAFFIVDAAGIHYEHNEVLRRLHEVANAPVFGYFASELGLGPIGGRLFQDSELGAQGARTAIRILRGEQAGRMPMQIMEAPRPTYDWRELRRWGISEARLPPGSVIEFRQRLFWELYWRWIVGGILLFCVQTALIAGLVVHRARRREQEAAATLIAELSSKFINLPPGGVDREIEDAQRRVCECLGLDLSALWQWTDQTPRLFKMTHLHRPLGGPPVPEGMDAQEMFPWCLRRLVDGELILFSSLTALPPEAARDREVWDRFGVKSNLTFPLSAGGELLIGALSFNTTREERSWSDEVVNRLQLVAQIFANALVRRKADHALRESEARLSLAADSASTGLWSLDLASGEFWMTPKTRELFHLGADQPLTLEQFFALVYPEDQPAVRQTVHEMVQLKMEAAMEYRVVLADGTVRWMRSRGRIPDSATRRAESVMGVTADITEHKQAEMELKRKEERFRQVAEIAEEFIWEVDANGLYTYASPSVEKILGYAPCELVGEKHFYDLFDPSVREELKAAASRVFSERQTFRRFPNRNISKGGKIMLLETSGIPMLDPGGNLAGYRGADIDVTERKQAEDARRQAQTTLDAIIDSTDDMIWSVDPVSFGLMTFNQAMRDYFLRGRGIRLRLGMRPEDLFPPGEYVERWRGFYQRAIEAGPFTTEYQTYTRELAMLLSFRVVKRDGEVMGVSVFGKNITEQQRGEREARRLREELAHVSRVATLGALSGSLAHELNQPLGIILSNAQAAQEMLLQQPPDLQEVQAAVADIVAADRRAGEVIQRLRSLFRQGEASLKPLSLNELIEEVLRFTNSDLIGRGVSVIRDLAADLPPVAGDRVQLQQVFINLILNASDAMSANAPGTRRLHLQTKRKDVTVCVAVRDEGTGLPGDVDHLFQPFYTTKKQGLGLGLAICRSIINAHHGRLWAEPHPERGAVFHFELPVAATRDEGRGTREGRLQ